MNNPPVTIGIDPAAPNGDHSVIFDNPRYTYYLLRKLEVVDTGAGNHELSAFLHAQGQHGDVLVTRNYMGKFQAYFWAGKKKHYWRKVDSRKYPDLMPQLRAALLLQQ